MDTDNLLPNFDDMFELAEEIQELLIKKLVVEVEIKDHEALIMRESMSNEKYFMNGKPPSVAYVTKAYLFTGFEGELLEKRNRLAEVSAKLDGLRLKFDLNMSLIDVWRTKSANTRKGFYE